MDFFATEFNQSTSALPHYQAPDFDRLRIDLLYRLRWDPFGSVNEIQVLEEPENPVSPLTPFASLSIASEDVADPPVSRFSVSIDCCEEKDSMDRGVE
jgi:hypothetical protein